ncbi:hypothetical protein [Cypionkella sp. TWP1-2-1b2]|uniref:hypothetical protein n=1 Tax=Cypionkella sp. TWP1-2-1b2 TaxID=2804675 RepID=UPI003CF99E6D
MTAILYYSRNPNPRLAVAVARHLGADVVFEFASPFDPAQSAKFRALNPSLRIPILLENGHSLWEADAIACRLSMRAGSNFWRMDGEMPEMIRWISWGKATFVQACDVVYFERGTKQRYGFGQIDQGVLAQSLADFHEHAAQWTCIWWVGITCSTVASDMPISAWQAIWRSMMWLTCPWRNTRRSTHGIGGLPRCLHGLIRSRGWIRQSCRRLRARTS